MGIIAYTAKGILLESFNLLNRMAPYPLFGFFFAGLIHIFLSPEKIAAHLGKGNFASVIKASLFGVPLPLCSCGVIPAALSLRREGASIGAVLAFLISTPTTGIDSIFATYSLMGGLFTVYRIMASFATGVLAGVLANILIKEAHPAPPAKGPCEKCGEKGEEKMSVLQKAVDAFRYAFVDLFDDVSMWLVIGIAIGGAIAFFIPEGFFAGILGSGLIAYLVMFAIGTPMYVCATGSIPIAASLMMKGLSPGAAFVFLISGPATNAVTVTVMAKELGKRAIAIYLGSIFIASLIFAFSLDRLWPVLAVHGAGRHALAHSIIPPRAEFAASLVLSILILLSLYRRLRRTVCPITDSR